MKKLFVILSLTYLTSCQINTPIEKSEMKMSFNVKNVSRVKSIEAYITNNFSSPASLGANPFGNNNKIKSNFINGKAELKFSNIPSGGPYFAVIAVYGDVIENPNRRNITLDDNTIVDSDKKWSRSINSVVISGSQKTFSDSASKLLVKIKLEKNSSGISINPKDGNNVSGEIIIN